MESVLDLIFDPSKKQRARRVLAYGVEGVGKSTWAAQWPGALFVPTEDGQRHIQCRSLPLQTDFDSCMAVLQSLYQLPDPYPFQTIVIDSIDVLESLLFASIANLKGKDSIQDIGYGKGFALASAQWRKLLNGLEWFTIHKKCNIVLIGHANVRKWQDPNGDTWEQYIPRLQEQSSCLVREWCDDVLFLNFKVFTREKEEGFNQKRTVGIDGGRMVYCTKKPAHIAKNRLGLPDEIPMTYAAYAAYLPKPEDAQPMPPPAFPQGQPVQSQPQQNQPAPLVGNIPGLVHEGSSKRR